MVETEKKDNSMTCKDGRSAISKYGTKGGNGPVLDNTLKNDDLPTFGKPVMGVRQEETP